MSVGEPGEVGEDNSVEISDLDVPTHPLWNWVRHRVQVRRPYLTAASLILALLLAWLVLSPLVLSRPALPTGLHHGVEELLPATQPCPWPSPHPPQPALAGIAVGANAHDVFLADLGYDRVEEIAAPGGRRMASWGCLGREAGQFDFGLLQGSAAAVDERGDLYIADEGNQRVQVFDGRGRFLRAWQPVGGPSSSRSGLEADPLGIAVQGGRVFVINFASGGLRLFSPDGRWLATWGNVRGGPLTVPTGIAVSAAGWVYVSDMRASRVLEFSPAGRLVASWGRFGRCDGCFETPMGIAVDANGDVFVADRDNSRVQKFDAQGRFLGSWPTWDLGRGHLAAPVGVAVDRQGHVYVIASNSGSVQEYDARGKRLALL